MAFWIIEPAAGPLLFPTVQHRHPNGTVPAVRERIPDVVTERGALRVERWDYTCPCSEVWTWERRSSAN